MASRVKKGDQVMVIAGRDKGETGTVLKVMRDEGRVIVEGVNRVHRHQRAQGNTPGGIIEKEAPIHISNVMPLDPQEQKPARVRAGQDKDGKKVRISAKSGTVIG